MLSEWLWRRALKRYARFLPRHVEKQCGRAQYIAPDEIRQCAVAARLPLKHIMIGHAMFLGRDDFDALPRNAGDTFGYETLRGQVAHLGFAGAGPVMPDSEGFDWAAWQAPNEGIFWTDAGLSLPD